MEDPYYEVRDAVKKQVDSIKRTHDSFQDLVRSADSTASQIKEMRRNLVIDIRAADKDFKVLKNSVANIEKDRSQYSSIKDSEFEARKNFISDMQKVLKIVKAGVESEAVKRKLDDDATKSKHQGIDGNYAAMSAGIEKSNSRFVENQSLQAKQMINVQDEALDALGQGVDRLNDLGSTINVELRDQNKLLGGLSGDMDEAEGKMNMVNHYLNKLLKSKDGCQYGTIAVLAIILLILVACIIWLPGSSSS